MLSYFHKKQIKNAKYRILTHETLLMSFIIHRNWSYKINIFSGLDFDMGNDALVYKTVETQAVYPLTA